MKRITAITFSVLAIFTTVRVALAQGGVIRATIPFDFTVENRSLPAGTYEIAPSPRSLIRIQNTLDPNIMTYVATVPDSMESHDRSTLTFEKYGDRYFLHEVFSPGVMNVNLFISKEERQIRQQAAMSKINDTDQTAIDCSLAPAFCRWIVNQ